MVWLKGVPTSENKPGPRSLGPGTGQGPGPAENNRVPGPRVLFSAMRGVLFCAICDMSAILCYFVVVGHTMKGRKVEERGKMNGFFGAVNRGRHPLSGGGCIERRTHTKKRI